LIEAEQRAAGVTHVLLKRRKMRHPQQLQASRTEDLGGRLGNVAFFGSKWPRLT
jgi:hypothetical protein